MWNPDTGADTKCPDMEEMCKIRFYVQLPPSDTIHKWTLAQQVDGSKKVWNPDTGVDILSAAERRGTPVLLSATVSDNSGNSPQVAAPRRPREINQSTQRCSLLDQIHTLSCTKQK